MGLGSKLGLGLGLGCGELLPARLHMAALLARVRVARGVGDTDGDEEIALEIDPVEDGAHRALEAILGHAAHVGLHAWWGQGWG